MNEDETEVASELEWLLYFYDDVSDALGPADFDVYENIKRRFERETGKKLPKEYRSEDDEG